MAPATSRRAPATAPVLNPETRGRVVVATDEFVYGGRLVERGELFELGGLRNDYRLLDGRLVREPHPDDESEACEHCGKVFATARPVHYAKKHADQPYTDPSGFALPRRSDDTPPVDRPPESSSDELFAHRGEV